MAVALTHSTAYTVNVQYLIW